MAIYNIFDCSEREAAEASSEGAGPKINMEAFMTNQLDENFIANQVKGRDQFFSALAARFFFFLLLIADFIWGVYTFALLIAKLALCALTLGQVAMLKKSLARSYLSFKRSIVCFIALSIALFSPALGIMFSCMYFLMYDKSGVDEVVPSSLRDQFKELFPI